MNTIKDSKGKDYKVSESGTCYSIETPDELINILERIRYNGKRVKLCYGDQATGKNWHEENDITGIIGRSTGNIKIPLLIATKRSYGGGGILTSSILKITETKTGEILYQHPLYQQPEIDIVKSDLPEYQYNTVINGKIHGRHKSLRSANICKSKLM